MGNTLTLLTDFAKDIGLDVVVTLKALNCFEAGTIEKEKEVLSEAELAGLAVLKKLQSNA